MTRKYIFAEAGDFINFHTIHRANLYNQNSEKFTVCRSKICYIEKRLGKSMSMLVSWEGTAHFRKGLHSRLQNYSLKTVDRVLPLEFLLPVQQPGDLRNRGL
ncbi:MAG: hypothetical protein HY810_02135 [Candidatus Omnitrophica bacterium]|nr:hypothetical protein [Candidatus Omnitrophota bacterium]